MKQNTLFLLLNLLCVFAPLRDTLAADKPNIGCINADDLAANAVGYSGNKDVITPHMDKLAQDRVRFMSHCDTTSICMASLKTIGEIITPLGKA